MHVVSLDVRNVRHLTQRRFEFSPGFNLLVGENGQGKSTVLRSLLTALGAEKNLRPSERFGDDDIRHRAREFAISVEYQDSNEQRRAIAERSWRGKTRRTGSLPSSPILWFGANEATAATLQGKPVRRYGAPADQRRELDEINLREEFLYREEFAGYPDRGGPSEFGRSTHVRRFVSEILKTFSPKFEGFGWRFVPYACRMEIPEKSEYDKKQMTSLRREVQAEMMRYIDESFYSNRRPISWGSSRAVRFHGNGKPIEGQIGARPIPEIRRIIDSVSRRLKLSTPAELSTIEVKLAPRISIIGVNGPLLLNQLSDGEKRLFSMIVDIARQLSLGEGGWRNIKQASAVVLVDEIDCHLHPRWQRMIVPALEDLFPACQFIATTHSPFVVQAVEAHQLQSLGPDEPLLDFTDKGIEEIIFKVMHIRNHEVSPRYYEMLMAAKSLYAAAHRAETADEREEVRQRLREIADRYASNPAFQAFLELKTEGLLGGDI